MKPGTETTRGIPAAAQLSHYMVARDSVGGPQEGRMGRLSSVALPEGSVAKGPTVPKLLLLTVAEKPEKRRAKEVSARVISGRTSHRKLMCSRPRSHESSALLT